MRYNTTGITCRCHITQNKKYRLLFYGSFVSLLEQIIISHNDESLGKSLARLYSTKDNLFIFLPCPGVDPTNNAAARALSEPTTHRKIRGCVRNQNGCQDVWESYDVYPYMGDEEL